MCERGRERERESAQHKNRPDHNVAYISALWFLDLVQVTDG